MRLWPKRWPRRKVIEDIDLPGVPYLIRTMWVKLRRLGVYTHRIYRPDTARCEHDHPWGFITIILRGGYEEEIDGRRYIRRPGYIGCRPRHFRHRITRLLDGPALTLVIRFRNHQAWNFYSKDRRAIHWQDYLLLPEATRVAWCDDQVDE